MRIRFLPLLVLSVIAAPAWSQSRTSQISLGAKSVALGMPKDQVIATLASTYRVEPSGSEDFWNVSNKPPYSDANPFTPIGSLVFESGKLVFISKRLFEAGPELSATAFSRAFQAVVGQFVAEEGSFGLLFGNPQPAVSCFMWTETYDHPESEEKRVVMQCGMKLLVMEWIRSDNGPLAGLEHVTIDENLGSRPTALQPKK